MISIKESNNTYIVSLRQTHKLNSIFAELIREQLFDLVGQAGRRVEFDLEGISFIDSTGFNCLLKLTDISIKIGSEFSLTNVSEEVMEIIEITGLTKSLKIKQRFVEDKLLAKVS